MKIVHIFAESLYAVQYNGEEENEYDRLLELWIEDQFYLQQYAKDHKIDQRKAFVDKIRQDAEMIDDFMYGLQEEELSLDVFFRPLHNMEDGFRELSLQKGKPNNKSYLRLYAIRIDSGTYLITGGAIKTVAKMQDSEELMAELAKLNVARNYLQDQGVFDKDSFQEFKTEQDEWE